MFPFAFLRVWSIVRRAIATRREVDSWYLTNASPLPAKPLPWRDASPEQIIDDLNKLANSLKHPPRPRPAIVPFRMFKHQEDMLERRANYGGPAIIGAKIRGEDE